MLQKPLKKNEELKIRILYIEYKKFKDASQEYINTYDAFFIAKLPTQRISDLKE